VSRAHETFVIVGAGQAGAWVARTLRTEGFDGRVVLIGEETHPPYERPPLSKAILSGQADASSAVLLTAQQTAAERIEHWPGATADIIDRPNRALICADGRTLTYDRLFLTTGARVRRLPYRESDGGRSRVHHLRTLDDAHRLRMALAAGGRLAVIGGGWIGLEVAATARSMGLEVTVLEAGARLCARSVPPQVSDFLAGLHGREGVDVQVDVGVLEVSADASDVLIRTTRGEVRADQLVVGIGVTPDTRLALAAGLQVDDGIVVTAAGQTSDSAIYAAGDVTRQPDPFAPGHLRLESWANAQNQAIVAAKAALGQDAVHAEPAWIWSDQFDVNLQIVGTPAQGVRVLQRASAQDGGGCWLALDDHGRAIGAVCANSPKDLRLIRKAIAARQTPDLAQWIDREVATNKIALLANP
jgi:3-phenylpropionate/trans-cinnamate dioxygenase ferredoxin reductase subunit